MKKNTPAKKSKNETFTCFLCLKSYNTSYNALKSHAMFTHKKKGQDGYVCENEDCQFKNKYKNSNHQCNGQEIWHKEKIDLHKQKKTEYVAKLGFGAECASPNDHDHDNPYEHLAGAVITAIFMISILLQGPSS